MLLQLKNMDYLRLALRAKACRASIIAPYSTKRHCFELYDAPMKKNEKLSWDYS